MSHKRTLLVLMKTHSLHTAALSTQCRTVHHKHFSLGAVSLSLDLDVFSYYASTNKHVPHKYNPENPNPRSVPRRHQYCLVSLRSVLMLASAMPITGQGLRSVDSSCKQEDNANTAHPGSRELPSARASQTRNQRKRRGRGHC